MKSNLPSSHFGASHLPQQGWFAQLASKTASLSGQPATFLLAVAVVVVWAITGPLFGFSDTWQLIINTGTTIVTFLMVFLIQNTQTRDTRALQLKLDELIVATRGADNTICGIETATDQELSSAKDEVQRRAEGPSAAHGGVGEDVSGSPR